MMDHADAIAPLRARLAAERAAGKRIAFVPTMGALHAGHLALVDDARAHADFVVMSIFVNPLQFRPGEDFERYPRTLDADRALADGRGVDLLFTPSVEEMYAGQREIRVVAGDAGARWDGEFRPGHFDGVLTVVAKLFNIVQPDVACFGQKDIQQVMLVRTMIRELDFPIQLSVVPTVREADGLAMSSRNAYLTAEQRHTALALSRALRAGATAWQRGERRADALQRDVRAVLDGATGLATDYIAVAEPERLAPVEHAGPGTVVAIAARVGATRLIDNMILGEEGG